MKPSRILIAEDDPVFRRILSFTLERRDFTVVVVGDGTAAWKELQSNPYDFLVTDQQMPSLTGLELLRHRINDPEIARIPAILCTAKAFEFDRNELIRSYALVDVMNKPFSPRMLTQKIEQTLQSSVAVA